MCTHWTTRALGRHAFHVALFDTRQQAQKRTGQYGFRPSLPQSFHVNRVNDFDERTVIPSSPFPLGLAHTEPHAITAHGRCVGGWWWRRAVMSLKGRRFEVVWDDGEAYSGIIKSVNKVKRTLHVMYDSEDPAEVSYDPDLPLDGADGISPLHPFHLFPHSPFPFTSLPSFLTSPASSKSNSSLHD